MEEGGAKVPSWFCLKMTAWKPAEAPITMSSVPLLSTSPTAIPGPFCENL